MPTRSKCAWPASRQPATGIWSTWSGWSCFPCCTSCPDEVRHETSAEIRPRRPVAAHPDRLVARSQLRWHLGGRLRAGTDLGQGPVADRSVHGLAHCAAVAPLDGQWLVGVGAGCCGAIQYLSPRNGVPGGRAHARWQVLGLTPPGKQLGRILLAPSDGQLYEMPGSWARLAAV